MKKLIVLTMVAAMASLATAALSLSLSGEGVVSSGGGNYKIQEGSTATITVSSDSSMAYYLYLGFDNWECSDKAKFFPIVVPGIPEMPSGDVTECQALITNPIDPLYPPVPGDHATVGLEITGVAGQTFTIITEGNAGNSPTMTFEIIPNCDISDLNFKNQWISVGAPKCWCAEVNPRQCHGDADGLSETKQSFWTYTRDLTTLLAAWGIRYPEIEGKADSNGVPLVCADFDRYSESKVPAWGFSVYTSDLNILLSNWGDGAYPAADCQNVTGVQPKW